MVGANKILTVSYGTFSCTLEGFEDPFSTMKAIAEYFRDLAAEDRYFGAEPPQPDAQMLHRIAEREVQRRVEARVQDNGVVLRAAEAAEAPVARPPVAVDDAAVTVAPALTPADSALSLSVAEKLRRLRAAGSSAAVKVVAPAEEPAPTLARLPEGFAEEADEVAPAAPAEAEAPVAAAPEPEEEPEYQPRVEAEFGADLTSLPDFPAAGEAAVETGPVAEAGPEAGIEAAEEPAIEPVAGEPADEETAAAFEPEAEAAAVEIPAGEPAAEEAGEAAEAGPVAEEAAMPAAPDLPEPAAVGALSVAAAQEDTIWADVAEDDDALIAALSADLGMPAAPEAPAAEPAADDDLTASLMAALAEELGEAPAPAPAAEEQPGPVPAADDLTDALIAALAAEEPPEAEAAPDQPEALPEAEEVAAVEAAPEAGLPEPEPEAEEPVAAADEAPAEARPADQPAPDTPDSAAALLAAVAPDPATEAAATAPVADQIAADQPPANERLQRARARVIRIRRIEPPAPAPLDPAAEAELQRELAALRGEADPATAPLPETRPLDEARASEAATETAPARTLLAAAEDDSVRRLLDTANSQMEEPESRRRMSAIAHLKAAVAATVADRRVAGEAAPQTEARRIDPYRSDLEQVTRPRRPVSAGAVTPRPSEPSQRPAPLVLVSEQRIDRPAAPAPAPRMATPVRPRRVASLSVAQAAVAAEEDDEDDFETAGDSGNIFAGGAAFAEFAERLGARELPDLLEAAAVYAACVEGRPSVTRPQLMKAVAEASPESEPGREDLLRSFGRLLRDGRIEKVRRGQFAVPETARVMQQGRQIAG